MTDEQELLGLLDMKAEEAYSEKIMKLTMKKIIQTYTENYQDNDTR
jgi:hypothetical protein